MVTRRKSASEPAVAGGCEHDWRHTGDEYARDDKGVESRVQNYRCTVCYETKQQPVEEA